MSPTAAMLILCHHHQQTKSTPHPNCCGWLKQLLSGWEVNVTRRSALDSPPEGNRLEKRFKEAIEMASW